MGVQKVYNGKTINEWAKETGLKRNTIASRLKEGWTIEDAISVPYGQRRKLSEISLYQLATQNGISHKTLKKRINAGMTITEALEYNFKKDIIGLRYGRLVVLAEVEPKRDPNGRPRRRYFCLCDCGNEVYVLGEALSSGNTLSCGCYRNELSSKRKEKDLTGQTFFRWYIEGEAFRDKYGIHWFARCICGNTGTPTTNNLLSGKSNSCGCYNLEQVSLLRKADITGKRFGIVTAIECVGQNKYKNYLWRCLCDCGNEFIVPASRLITGETQSCGCVHSRAEQFICKYLKENNIKFKRNAFFEDLKLKGLLFFDFMIWDKNNKPYLIEYQGIQHYKEFNNGFGDQQRNITDSMKKEYCEKNNYILFEIRYDEDLSNKLKEIIAQVNPVLSKY